MFLYSIRVTLSLSLSLSLSSRGLSLTLLTVQPSITILLSKHALIIFYSYHFIKFLFLIISLLIEEKESNKIVLKIFSILTVPEALLC